MSLEELEAQLSPGQRARYLVFRARAMVVAAEKELRMRLGKSGREELRKKLKEAEQELDAAIAAWEQLE